MSNSKKRILWAIAVALTASIVLGVITYMLNDKALPTNVLTALITLLGAIITLLAKNGSNDDDPPTGKHPKRTATKSTRVTETLPKPTKGSTPTPSWVNMPGWKHNTYNKLHIVYSKT